MAVIGGGANAGAGRRAPMSAVAAGGAVPAGGAAAEASGSRWCATMASAAMALPRAKSAAAVGAAADERHQQQRDQAPQCANDRQSLQQAHVQHRGGQHQRQAQRHPTQLAIEEIEIVKAV